MTDNTERAAFEADVSDMMKDTVQWVMPNVRDNFFARIGGDRYFRGWLQSRWEGWQARAALPVRDLTDEEIDEVYELPRAYSAFIYQARDVVRRFCEVNGLRIGLPVREGVSPAGCDYGDRCVYPRCVAVGSCHRATTLRTAGVTATQAPSDSERALDLLDTLFTAYEDGFDVYEDPDEMAGHLGHAVKLDDETFHACADLLNRRRPREGAAGVVATELPDAIRVPLDELDADARYLAARLANGTMAVSVGTQAIQRRTRAIREALGALGVPGTPAPDQEGGA